MFDNFIKLDYIFLLKGTGIYNPNQKKLGQYGKRK